MIICKFMVTGYCSKLRWIRCAYAPFNMGECPEKESAKDIPRTNEELRGC